MASCWQAWFSSFFSAYLVMIYHITDCDSFDHSWILTEPGKGLYEFFWSEPHSDVLALFLAESVYIMLTYHRWWISQHRPCLSEEDSDSELDDDDSELVSEMDALDQQLETLQKEISPREQDSLRFVQQVQYREEINRARLESGDYEDIYEYMAPNTTKVSEGVLSLS